MLKSILAAAFLTVTLPLGAFAACTLDSAMARSSDISEVLMPKLQSKPDEASRIMSEMGDAIGDGNVSELTCTKLDALLVRAKKL